MSRGQAPRRPAYFPQMKHRGAKRHNNPKPGHIGYRHSKDEQAALTAVVLAAVDQLFDLFRIPQLDDTARRTLTADLF